MEYEGKVCIYLPTSCDIPLYMVSGKPLCPETMTDATFVVSGEENQMKFANHRRAIVMLAIVEFWC